MALLLIPLAHAYTLAGSAWPLDQTPVEIHWTGAMEGFTPEELQATVEGAAAAWTAAAPCAFAYTVVEDADTDAWFADGGQVAVLFGDPGGELEGQATASIGFGQSSGSGFSGFPAATPMRFVFASSPAWIADAVIDAGECTEGVSLQSTLTRSFGYAAGLAQSCGESEPCDDEDAVDATMYWSTTECDDHQSTLNDDDIAGIQALYDRVTLPFACTADPTDSMAAICAITTTMDVDSIAPTWDFGDGSVVAGGAVAHTYAARGTHLIELCLQPPACEDPPVCDAVLFAARGTDDTGDLDGDVSEAPCGCVTQHPGSSWIGASLALLALGRRRTG